MSLEFLKNADAKPQIFEWREVDGVLFKDLERILYIKFYLLIIAELKEMYQYT
jgi:hypothetical protein